MQGHAGDGDVFIRSMASRGHVGGLAGATAEAAAVLDACGFDLVLIETVGAGQSEVEVAAIADTTVVVEAPDMGDEVQALKAGLLEVADIVVVSKADRPGADQAAARLRATLGLGRRATDAEADGDRPRPTDPQVLLASGLAGQGIGELLAALDEHRARRASSPAPQAARLARARAVVEGILVDRAREALRSATDQARVAALLAAVARHELDPYAAAAELLGSLSPTSPHPKETDSRSEPGTPSGSGS
jgi:LAO/AO transport system kinase